MYSVERSLKDLPALFTLDMTLKTLLVDNLPSDQHSEAFALVQDSAARGDNIGVDEFPTLEDFRDVLLCSAAFSLRDATSGTLLSVIVVHPSNYSRSQGPYFATLHLITADEISQKPYWRDLARLSRDLVVRLKLRYGAVVANVFCPCVDRLQALTEEGFVVTACINEAGTLVGSRSLTCSYILNSEFGLRSLPKYPPSLVCDAASNDRSVEASSSLPSEIPFLPIDHLMPDGTEVVVRCVLPGEASDFDRMFESGFGLDEWPVGSFFERTAKDFYNVVIVEKSTGTKMAAVVLGTSSYSRGTSARLTDAYGAIHPDYAGCGIAKEVSGLIQELAAALGYRAIHTDTTVDNMAAMAVLLGDRFVMTGVIPKSVYVADRGWVDVAVFYKSLTGAGSRNSLGLRKNEQIMSKL